MSRSRWGLPYRPPGLVPGRPTPERRRSGVAGEMPKVSVSVAYSISIFISRPSKECIPLANLERLIPYDDPARLREVTLEVSDPTDRTSRTDPPKPALLHRFTRQLVIEHCGVVGERG